MSISFNHPSNTVTSTGTLNLVVNGGNVTSPQPIRFSSTSVVMPVRALPTGEAGAMVFDTATKTMKYHDGFNWIEILGEDVILSPIYTAISNIETELSNKVDSVTYISGTVPQASINGSQLSITFPLSSGGGGSTTSGLFTSSKQGSIQMYALNNGMNASSIREQMSGQAGGQAGRNGTQSSPWITNDGWCFSDGMWWTWTGANGTVTRQVPNLNQQAYLKPMAVSGVIQTSSIIGSSGSIGGTSLSIAQLPAHNFSFSGQTTAQGEHVHRQLYNPMGWNGTSSTKDGTGRDDSGSGVHTTQPAGSHFHYFSGNTNTLGSGQSHTHSLNNVDVSHFNVAVIYNIATAATALNEAAANGKYVLKSGDIMSGSLTVLSNMSVRGGANNISLTFNDNEGGERGAVYHSYTNNTLRLRANGGTEVTINQSGLLTTSALAVSGNIATVNSQNIVRSVNGTAASTTGEVTLSVGVQDVRFSAIGTIPVSSFISYNGTGRAGYVPDGAVVVALADSNTSSQWIEDVDTIMYRYVQKQINGSWVTVGVS